MGALLLFKVNRQISRSLGTKNRWFWPELSISRLKLQFEFTDGYEMMLKVWYDIEEMLYCFWGHPSNLKITWAEKIDDLKPIWVRLLDRTQISNPSDLLCLFMI